MRILKIFSSAMFCAAGLTLLCANANAAVIPVVNPVFDQFPAGFTGTQYFQQACGPGCALADRPLFGWNSTATLQRGALSGQWLTGLPSNQQTFKTAPLNGEPIVFRDINDTTSQVVGVTALAGYTYTLSVEMGFDISHNDLGDFQLWVGGTEVTGGPGLNDKNDPRQKSGNWYDYSVSYTASSLDAGDSIMIALASITGDATPVGWFADVRLTDTAPTLALGTPEPSTWVMLLAGFGLMGLGAFYRGRSATGAAQIS
jgi:PEP-CTERM motif